MVCVNSIWLLEPGPRRTSPSALGVWVSGLASGSLAGLTADILFVIVYAAQTCSSCSSHVLSWMTFSNTPGSFLRR